MLMQPTSPTAQQATVNPQQQIMLQNPGGQGGSYSPYSSLQPAYPGSFVGTPVRSPQGMQAAGNLPVTYINTTGPGGIYVPTGAAPRGDGRTNPSTKQASGGAECKGAEEECTTQEECGGDDKRPNPEKSDAICGVDRALLLAPGWTATTIIGGAHMLCLTIPVLRAHGNVSESVSDGVFYGMLTLYILSLLLMLYCGNVDPGQLPAEDGAEGDDEMPRKAPRRSHKTWLYERPVRRFDHYCRWLRNSIGLLNHREFFAMLMTLLLIGLLGLAIDTYVFAAVVRSSHIAWGSSWDEQVSLALVFCHVFYDLILLYFVGPIIQQHIGLIGRNELAKEFNNDVYRFVKETSDGRKDVAVEDLSSDEYNTLPEDALVYDPNRNPWDKGCCQNCSSFWCRARWSSDEMGEF
mmetsp:Transcript_61863/g.109894  ORF Transcript_61863/g.109894 Transcript_61863/m.109894 type:complete len:407 (+) Transcript_61863:91-1311(+)